MKLRSGRMNNSMPVNVTSSRYPEGLSGPQAKYHLEKLVGQESCGYFYQKAKSENKNIVLEDVGIDIITDRVVIQSIKYTDR